MLDLGVPIGVFDDTGMSAIAVMIERMPHIAIEGLNQFQTHDPVFGRDSVYLNYLEHSSMILSLFGDSEDGSFDASVHGDRSKKMNIERSAILLCPVTALEVCDWSNML